MLKITQSSSREFGFDRLDIRPRFLPFMKAKFTLLSLLCFTSMFTSAEDHLFFKAEGESLGKHVVLLAGDEEYRSEEAMPMLAKILSREGYDATVLFSLNADGIVDPNNQKSLGHSEALDKADAIVMSIRFRNWDDQSMQRFENALNRGVPMVALRTSTHAFKTDAKGKWAKYSFNAKKETGWEKGFGRQVLGETWVNHHGKHKKEGCRTHVAEGKEKHPILNGVEQIFCTSDVYGANPLQPSDILLHGEVTETFDPKSKGVEGKNDPMQPVVWTREFKNEKGSTNKIVTTTMGAASDLADGNLRRLVVNSVFWGLGVDVPEKINVDVKGFNPTFYSNNIFKANLKPKDFTPGSEAFNNAPAYKDIQKAKPKKKAPKKEKTKVEVVPKAEPKEEKKLAVAPASEEKKNYLKVS